MTDAHEVFPMQGNQGELIDRLVSAIEVHVSDSDYFELTSLNLKMMLGLRSDYRDREQLTSQVKARLTELVMDGISEVLIVRAVRDELRRAIDRFSDIGSANTNRQETREALERILTDPDELAVFRARLAESLPSDVPSEDQIRADLNRMIATHFQPIDADSAARTWTYSSGWASACERWLSDPELDAWQGLNIARHVRGN